ncbi:hypothetical protein CLV58_109189 [Spirosoma oryzae]|uniref:Uncharacterized protein n=1 Tax=Spirosoma oryzae TaxID=1469603 RepID=A0A2T0SYG7_9BACT|nr:hypothetical protein [Spirosoma oryzae]PRY38462.1 hypothetical protein CLV58_109189 [Spirosoma oryzae]
MKKLYYLLLPVVLGSSCKSTEATPDYTGTYSIRYQQVVSINSTIYNTQQGVSSVDIKKGSSQDRLLLTSSQLGGQELIMNGKTFTGDPSYTNQKLTGEFTENGFSYTAVTGSIANTDSDKAYTTTTVTGNKQ